MATYIPPKRGVAFVFYVALVSQASRPQFQSSATIASGDFTVSKDGGAFANLTTLPTVAPAAGSQVKISLSASEMDADIVTVLCHDVAGSQWDDLLLVIPTAARQIDDLLPTTSYTTPPTVSAIRTELDTNSTKLDVAVSTRNAIAPDNATIATIQAKTVNLPSDPADASDIAALLDTIDNFVDTEIAAIKAKTDLIGAASVTVTTPVSTNGNLTIYRGDSYVTGSTWGPLEWVETTGAWLPFVGETATFTAEYKSTTITRPAVFAVVSGNTVKATVELRSADTAAVKDHESRWAFDIQVTTSLGVDETPIAGIMTVLMDVTPAS